MQLKKYQFIKSVFFSCLVMVAGNAFAQKEYNIKTYGAKGDGKTNNAAAIQSAINAAAKAGRGKVVVPSGSFVTGPIRLKSGVTLHVQKGALLSGSTKRLDYGEEAAVALISAQGATNISITGDGTIDGRGREVVEDLIRQLKARKMHDTQWPAKGPREENRPQIITFAGCSNVTVKGVTIKNSAAWVQTYLRCYNVHIDSINVESIAYWNNDGIDIVNSKNVSITNCTINAADDAICLKSEGKVLDSCVNVYVANCRLRSSASAFKIGTGSKGGFRNIVVRNLEVYDTYRSAVALEAVDGGFLENVDVKGIRATNTGNALFIRLGHRNKDETYSRVKNISIADMYVEVPAGKPDKGYPMEGPGLKYPPGFVPSKEKLQSVSPWNHSSRDSTAIPYPHNVFPSSIAGLPNHPVENVSLENIEIVYAGGASKNVNYFSLDSLHLITEAESSYPEFSMFGELPAWGLYVRHVKDLELNNVKIRYTKEDFRTPMIFDDVEGLVLRNIIIPMAKEAPAILLHNVRAWRQDTLTTPFEDNEEIRVQ